MNPDPGTQVDFPGVGDEVGRTINWALRTKAGKFVQFYAEKGARFANVSEWKWTQRLLDEGNNVVLLKDSTEAGVRRADYLINGVATDLKEISEIGKTDPDNLSEGIARIIKESSGQGKALILDLTKQQGATFEVAKRGVSRYYGQGSSKQAIRVVGNGYDKVLTKDDFKKKK